MALINPVMFGGSSSRWQRPSTWLARPTIAAGTKTVRMLVAVFPNASNYIKLQAAGNLTINWGDGNTIDYSSPDVEYNLDYAGISTYLVGTVKQCWINVSVQAGQSISKFILNFEKTTTLVGFSANQNILEILVGTINMSTNYNFYLAKMRALKCIAFLDDFSSGAYNLLNVFLGNYNLECIQGTFVSNYYNSQMFLNCYSLKFLSQFNYTSTNSSTAQSAFSNTAIEILDLTNFIANTCQTLVSNCRNLRKLTHNVSAMGNAYQLALNCYCLEEYVLVGGDGSASNTYYQAFHTCNFAETPAINLTNSTTNVAMFENNYRLVKSNLSNIKASIGFRYCNLSHAGILNIFTNQLQTVGYPQTIDLRNNPDIANLPAATIAVATAKNWTVQIA